MKLTSNRYYFDYNATSPLADSVKKWISSGDLFIANPNSLHSSGRESLKLIKATEEFLLNTYKLKNDYDLFFHSGASEGINTFIINELNKIDGEGHLVLFDTDHSSAFKTKYAERTKGTKLHIVSFVNENGELKLDELINFLKSLKGKIILNYTLVNNETGIIWPMANAEKIKKETGAFIHVDATQSVCKMQDWDKLSNLIDAYTFSGHKFGAFAGVGFSFYKKDYKINYLIYGSRGVLRSRPGTPNVIGIYSIKLALEEAIKRFDSKKSKEAIDYLVSEFDKLLKGKGRVLFKDSSFQNLNTITLYFNEKKGQDIVNLLDMHGFQVGVGSACSSGIISSNRVMMAIGISEEQSNNNIRLSFEIDLDLNKAKEYFKLISEKISKFI